jgi:selenide,water dikinase
VLLGGGHAHVEVLRELAHRPVADVACVLVTPGARHHYSGMVPGFLRGTYGENDLSLDLAALARAAGARLVPAAAVRIDPAERTVWTEAGPETFDLCSCDVGAAAAGLAETPGAAEHAFALRPIAGVGGLRATLDRMAAAGGPAEPTACVVGGGAAGVEVALALVSALGARGRRPAVTLVERQTTLLPGHAPRARAAAQRVLAARGVTVRAGASVASVSEEALTLADGTQVPSACTVWLAGAAAPSVIAESPLPHGAGRFLQVDATLRAVDGSPVWGAGDCIALEGAPWMPRSGVYAVRQGPVLAHNLRAALDGRPPRAYRPQRSALALLATGDDRAILAWRALAAEGRWVWTLKDAIDRRWVRKYRVGAEDTFAGAGE